MAYTAVQVLAVTPSCKNGDMTNTNRRLQAIATGQLGLVSRRQAYAAGVTSGQLRSRVSSGTLHKFGRQTYLLPGAPMGPMASLRALLLDIGGDAMASGRTAAAMHGFDGYSLAPPFDIVIARGRDVQRVGHRIHTATRLDLIDRSIVDDISTLSGARTLIDLARTETVDRLMVAFDCGLRDGKFNESLLHRRIVALRSSGRFGIPKLLEAIDGYEIGSGGHSWLERRFLQIVADGGLRRPDTQQVLTRARDRQVRVDFRFPGSRVVAEVLGYRYHRTQAQISRDALRINALVSEGFDVYQFTYRMVTEMPDEVVDTIRSALSR